MTTDSLTYAPNGKHHLVTKVKTYGMLKAGGTIQQSPMDDMLTGQACCDSLGKPSSQGMPQ
eukprot:1136742-Pelagomonas_calceolata.AAC.3